ncbi:MAG TPA: GIY-YIG nuclease family protein [Syntrophomonadaceae bacterium]|nr:GIY-YIG nuclease family protein [Syntrophomonadaceae bacterium]HQA06939.1 GIY-YIG nuclease family protein [Syntrophomonadaceae bacterium]HQE23168.1 GIY-YIG nuclease family protein [Syntrophomonadaceae bacterium]
MKISGERKKELQEQFKQMKPDMGILAVINMDSKRCWLEAATNLKGKQNSVAFQLKNGSHINRQLQKDWNEQGEQAFQIVVLEQLEYDKDESKTDYRDDLELLKMIWIDKLTEQGVQFY